MAARVKRARARVHLGDQPPQLAPARGVHRGSRGRTYRASCRASGVPSRTVARRQSLSGAARIGVKRPFTPTWRAGRHGHPGSLDETSNRVRTMHLPRRCHRRRTSRKQPTTCDRHPPRDRDDPPSGAHVHTRARRLIIGALMLGCCSRRSTRRSSRPRCRRSSATCGESHLSWVVTAYLLASTVSTPFWGKLGDLYGRKGFFQVAIVIFLVGSVAVRAPPDA